MDTKLIVDFIAAVSRMRYCQQQYFQTRNHFDLLDAKRTEQQVDQYLKQFENYGIN
jgi:hypothetical protein